MKWGDRFEIDNLKIKLKEIEKKCYENNNWADKDLIKEKKRLENKIYEFGGLAKKINNIFDLIDLSQQENDLSLLSEIVDLKNKFVDEFDKFKLNNLLNEEYDFNNAIVSLHAGAGGTESCDWVEMLLRMYNKFCDKHGFKFKIMDLLPGEEAGIKSVVFEVLGDNAYGYLKSEKGVHRLIRISPFDSSKRRHTSFASCDVMPEINNDDNEIKILDDEIRVDTYRSSGAGGQHVNTTDSAIRITHLPTGIVVQCQNERSQRQNREFALNMLKSKLLLLKLEEEKAKINNIRGEQKEIAWGSQIRTYVFHPYNMVKDHRTNVETGNIKSVMEGEIDLFINAFLAWNK
ncbi:MAG: peptide chain release factor 2 [Firmicutes bacterium]|nr:peptide chain release factor 2 [Bacillota bacterium]